MTRFFLAGAAVLGLLSSAAIAQTSVTTDQVTTTTMPVAPVTVTNTTQSGDQILPDGRHTVVNGSAVSDSNGNGAAQSTATTTYPLSRTVTTTQKSTEMVNGVPTQTITTTQGVPGGTTPPTVTTITK